MIDLGGKVAVITGASRGIGAGLATAFAARGLRLGLCARGPIAPPPGAEVVTAAVDVTDGAAVDRFATAVIARFGAIDLWVNNAGVLGPIDRLREVDGAALRQHLEVNVMGVFHGARAYARHVRSRPGGGVLVNISSGAGRRPYVGWSAYCAGKAAVDRLSECLALEEADAGLAVYAIAPGIVDTAMQAEIRATPAERFPMVDKFLAYKAEGRHSSTRWVADRLLEACFDPAHRPSEVICGLPPEHPL